MYDLEENENTVICVCVLHCVETAAFIFLKYVSQFIFLHNVFLLLFLDEFTKDVESNSAPCCSFEGKGEPMRSLWGKLAIKIQQCMVMNTRLMVKGSH